MLSQLEHHSEICGSLYSINIKLAYHKNIGYDQQVNTSEHGYDTITGGSSSDHIETSMTILLWNCMGANGVTFMSNLCTLIEINNPSILSLTETKMEYHDKILQALYYMDVLHVPAVGYSRGITLLWRNTEATVEPFIITEHDIHTTIEVSSTSPKWFLSVIYAKNSTMLRKML